MAFILFFFLITIKPTSSMCITKYPYFRYIAFDSIYSSRIFTTSIWLGFYIRCKIIVRYLKICIKKSIKTFVF